MSEVKKATNIEKLLTNKEYDMLYNLTGQILSIIIKMRRICFKRDKEITKNTDKLMKLNGKLNTLIYNRLP